MKAGDTLYGISNQYGVSVTELAELNNIKGSNLQIGQILKIPSKSGTNPNNMFMYTVKLGDTLYSIARKYNTTPDAIKDINYLTSDNLKVGQVIRIPETYTKEEDMYLPSYVNYTVRNGDTLYSIAREYGVSVDILIKDNVLENSNLKPGQNLKIRVDDSFVEECYGTDYTPPLSNNNTLTYTVKKGDSLYTIAKKYSTSVDTIKKLNNLISNNLQIGQILKIPSSNNNSNIYIVKSGDNLYSIARNFGVTVDSIRKKNNLKSNLLSIGQKLII